MVRRNKGKSKGSSQFSRRYRLNSMLSVDGNQPRPHQYITNVGVVLSAVAPILTASGAGGQEVVPRLFHALNACVTNWEEYRIHSATLIYYAHKGTNQGTVSVVSSPDANDNTVAQTSGPAAVGGDVTTFPAGRTTPKRIPLRIDSSWKKVSTILTRTIGTGTTAVTVPVNTLNDLAVGGFTVMPVGGQADELYHLAVEVDIETRGPRLGAGAA